jgi:hypothetical protein
VKSPNIPNRKSIESIESIESIAQHSLAKPFRDIGVVALAAHFSNGVKFEWPGEFHQRPTVAWQTQDGLIAAMFNHQIGF